MSVKPTANEQSLRFPQTHSSVKPAGQQKTWSLDQIRGMRQSFEQETSGMRNVLGDTGHQTMLVAMYESSERLLHQRVSDFAVMQYLEGLKQTAQELRQRGLSDESFRGSLMAHAHDSIDSLIASG